jgi:hypothetical protein
MDEYTFESLADFEAALASMAAPPFQAHSDALAPLIVPGSLSPTSTSRTYG